MPTSFTNRDRVYDFLKWYVEERFCFVSGTIQNQTGATIAAGAITPGTPLNLNGTQYETINAAAEAGTDAFFVDERIHEELAAAAITAKQYRLLVRGPALINKTVFPDNDLAGPTAYDKDALETRANALDIQVLVEPTNQEEQIT